MDIIPTDPDPGAKWPGQEPWTPLERLTARQAMALYPDRNLLMCWPTLAAPWPAQAVMEFRGNHLILMGEERNGFTGTGEMFDTLEQDYRLEKRHEIPRSMGHHDRMEVWQPAGFQNLLL